MNKSVKKIPLNIDHYYICDKCKKVCDYDEVNFSPSFDSNVITICKSCYNEKAKD